MRGVWTEKDERKRDGGMGEKKNLSTAAELKAEERRVVEKRKKRERSRGSHHELI